MPRQSLAKINRAFYLTFSGVGTPQEAEIVMDYLKSVYGGNPLGKLKDGSVDANTTIANAAQLAMLSDIEGLIEDGRVAK